MTTTASTLSTTEVITLARKHLGGAMKSSALLCLTDAECLVAKGDDTAARSRAVKSLAYSVGVFHAAYVAASGGEHWSKC